MHPSTLSRRKFLTLSGAAAAAGLFARFAPATACPIRDELDALESAKKLAGAINAFAADLHTRLARDAKGSLFFSPFSIETALGMTSAGARGKTLEEMQKTLHLWDDPHAAFGQLLSHLNGPPPFKLPDRKPGRPILPDPDLPPLIPVKRGYELSVANAIWAMKDYPWRKEFLDLTRTHYGSGVIETDFAKSDAARKEINAWVEKQTREKIKELIPDGVLNALTRMVLVNAIYFKGTWQYTFDKKETADAAFTRADGTKADVPLMYQTEEFNYGKMHVGSRSGQAVQILELPYSGRELSMLVYLPEKPDGANRLALSKDDIAAPKLEQRKVHVYLPRFKVETEYSLQPALVDLGMKAAFFKADFTGMHTSDEYLFISHVLHKAFVEVNEEGTEAAAATAVVVAADSAIDRKTVVFRADRPFVFVIRDNRTGTALFMGRYSGPR
jgi:serpin B